MCRVKSGLYARRGGPERAQAGSDKKIIRAQSELSWPVQCPTKATKSLVMAFQARASSAASIQLPKPKWSQKADSLESQV